MYVPALEYVWLGFCEVLVPPSPKFQDQLVMEALPAVDWSVKFTAKGACPDVGLPLNCAVGGMDGSLTDM